MADWVTSEVAAEILGVSRPTIRKMIDDGRLQPLGKVNGRIYIFNSSYLNRVKASVHVAEVGKRLSKERAI